MLVATQPPYMREIPVRRLPSFSTSSFSTYSEWSQLCEFDAPSRRWFVVNQHRHHVPVEDVNHLVAMRDDVVLVPVVDLDVAAEFVLVADGRQQPRLLALFRPHHLTAPSHDSARRAAFVILAAIAIGAVEIGLRTAHVPFGFRRRIRRPPRLPAGTRPARPAASAPLPRSE